MSPKTESPNKGERFKEELLALGGNIVDVSSGQLVDAIASFLRGRGVSSVLAWDWEHLPAGLQEALLSAGIEALPGADPTAQAGITGVLCAVSDTGTLVIPGGTGRPQSASLLPELHIAVLYREKIITTLAEALRLSEIREAPTVVLVSGPSRTADIEMTLTIGVHGPGELHVFLVNDSQ